VKRTALCAVAAAALGLAAACGDSGGPGGPSEVLLFTNASFVDYDTSDMGSEASQMEYTLNSFGVATTPFTAYDSASFAAILPQHRVLVIPEQENNWLVDSMTLGARTALRRFVDSGGGLLIVSADNGGIVLVDSVFRFTMVPGTNNDAYRLRTDAPAPFAGGPAIIWNNDGTNAIETTGMPPAQWIYQGDDGGVPVAVIHEGRGAIVMLGWDWYAAAPHGPQDGGWIEVLRRALRVS
jgi:hypothetical protein